MDLTRLIPGLIKNKALNYKISKNKYKILVNVFKNHKKMNDGEVISHLQFVYDMIYPIDVARDILEKYTEPQLAFNYYKNGFSYLKSKEKKEKVKINFPTSDSLLVALCIVLMGIFMASGSVFLMIDQNNFLTSLFKDKLTLGLTMISLTFIISLFVSPIQVGMYSAKKFVNMEKKETK